MPFVVNKRDGKFCVIKVKNNTREIIACHDTRREAISQVQAINISENEKDKNATRN